MRAAGRAPAEGPLDVAAPMWRCPVCRCLLGLLLARRANSESDYNGFDYGVAWGTILEIQDTLNSVWGDCAKQTTAFRIGLTHNSSSGAILPLELQKLLFTQARHLPCTQSLRMIAALRRGGVCRRHCRCALSLPSSPLARLHRRRRHRHHPCRGKRKRMS